MDDNFKYILDKLDHITDTVNKTLLEATKTNGTVRTLNKDVDILKEEVKTLKEASQVEKGKAKIINMIIGGVGAATFFIIEQALRYLKIFK